MRFLRTVSAAALLVFLASSPLSSHAQKILHNSEVSVSAFGEFTSNVSGNGITQDTSKSLGGQAALRHSYHWWLGFEGSYNYSRFTEYYSGQPFPVQHNMHDFGGSYLVTGPSLLGFRPSALAGISAIVFSPSLNGGQNVSWQARPGLNFGVGLSRALFTEHLGLRVQYRGVYYKAPDFGETALTTGKYRLTSEPMAGLYLRF